MINMIFRDGNRHVDPARDLEPELIGKFAGLSRGKEQRFVCPTHKSRSHATILVNVAPGSKECDIVDFCCEDFCREIRSGMPYPWNQLRSSRRLETAAWGDPGLP